MPNITQIVTSSDQKILIAMIITIMIIIIMNKMRTMIIGTTTIIKS